MAFLLLPEINTSKRWKDWNWLPFETIVDIFYLPAIAVCEITSQKWRLPSIFSFLYKLLYRFECHYVLSGYIFFTSH